METIKQTFGVALEVDPIVCILGYIGGGGIIRKRRIATIRCLFLARKLIVKRWTARSPPTHTEWLKEVDIAIKRGSAVYTKRRNNDGFKKIWGAWLNKAN